MADPIESNPELYSVAFENDRVRVLRYHDRPGDRTRQHSHPDSVMITAAAFERRLHHGERSVDVSLTAGEVRWLDAQEHAGENIGETESLAFFVELKDSGRGGSSAVSDAEASLGPR